MRGGVTAVPYPCLPNCLPLFKQVQSLLEVHKGVKASETLIKGHGHLRSGLHVIVQKHVWDQLFTVDTIWNIGETGDI